jgi:hypothetical protein
MTLALGMISRLAYHKIAASKIPPTKYGLRNLLKLIPLARIAITSDRLAILLVKNITAIKTKIGKRSPTIKGMKPSQYCLINSTVLSPLCTKLSVFSLLSIATAITTNNRLQKMNVTRKLLNIYQSSLCISKKPNVDEMNES